MAELPDIPQLNEEQVETLNHEQEVWAAVIEDIQRKVDNE